jgi:hypothetical protein
MTKITDIPACDMPHGVKTNGAGTRLYVSCMHSDEILELEVGTLQILRRARTGQGPAAVSSGPARHGAARPTSLLAPILDTAPPGDNLGLGVVNRWEAVGWGWTA